MPKQENLGTLENDSEETPEQENMSDELKKMAENVEQNQEDPEYAMQEGLDALRGIEDQVDKCESYVEIEKIQEGLGLSNRALAKEVKYPAGDKMSEAYEGLVTKIRNKKLEISGKTKKLVEQADEQWSGR